MRLSVPTVVAECPQADTSAFAGIACRPAGEIPRATLASIAGRAAAAIRRSVDADAIHAAALVDLISDDTSGNALGRSISYLEMATRLDSSSIGPLIDLSAAYLAAAAARSDAFQLLLALDVASRAVERDPENEGARFNRALALTLLTLDGEATKEWNEYLSRDAESAWATVARAYAARSAPQAIVHQPRPDAADDSIARYALAAPFDARAFAWKALLGGWGAAVTSGESTRAARLLHAASVVARVLADSLADSTIAHAVQSINDRRSSPPALSQLAALHARFASALRRTDSADYLGADSIFTAMLSDRHSSPVLQQWATYNHANALLYVQRRDEAEAIARALLNQIDHVHQPSLAGRTQWLIGMIRLRRGHNDAGLATVREARRSFERAGEVENVFGAVGVGGEVAFRSGDDATGYLRLHESLLGLRRSPANTWRHNVLYLLAGKATLMELDRAAAAIEDEDYSSAAGGRAPSMVEARLARARSLWAAGDERRAAAIIDTTARVVASLPSLGPRHQLEMELSLTRATGPLRGQPEVARALLDTVVSFYTPPTPAQQPNAAKLVPALLARADAAIALRRDDLAEADLARAATLYEAQRDSLSSLPLRAALLARARSVFESLVTLRLAGGRVAEALDALERSRAFYTRSVLLPLKENAVPAERETIVDYAYIGDTVFSWVMTSKGLRSSRSNVDRRSFRATVTSLRAGFELGAPEEELRAPLARLYEWVVRPIAQYMEPDSGLLTIVADERMGDVPFAALFDTRRNEYLVQRRAIRFVPTLSHALMTKTAATTRPQSALFVSGTEVDAKMFPGLPPLPYAEIETQIASKFYVRTRILSGSAADSATVVRAIPSVDVFHFAGHALFDDVRPERSRLVVRPNGLTAGTIAALDLRRLRLVVLSACESVRGSERRGSGFAGVADAFVAGGAGGVIGNTWRLADAPTADLMRTFHGSYKTTTNAVSSLRDAQLRMLSSESPRLRSPATWGGFRYTGM